MIYKDWALYRLIFANRDPELLVMAFPEDRTDRTQFFLAVAAISPRSDYSYEFIDYAIRPGFHYVQLAEEVSIEELPLFLHWRRGRVFDQLLAGKAPPFVPIYFKGTYV